jgi:hypothetical protein
MMVQRWKQRSGFSQWEMWQIAFHFSLKNFSYLAQVGRMVIKKNISNIFCCLAILFEKS